MRLRTFKISRLFLLIVILFQMNGLVSTAQPNDSEAEAKLLEITEEEKGIIEKLFLLSSEIEFLNTKLTKLGEDIASIETRISNKEKEIEVSEKRFEGLKNNLSEVLKIQQRSGIASNIEIILNAKNLKDLVNRINLLRDLSKNVDQLMNDTMSVSRQLEKEKESLKTLLTDMENQETLLAETAKNKTQAKLDLENYLSSLASEKAHYQDYLKSIETLWESLKPLFADTIANFTKIIESGDLPEDTVEVNVSLFNTRGTIQEDKFNAILEEREDLPQMKFEFKEEGISLSFPSHQVVLEGTFELVDNQTIQYVVKGGAFFDLPMSPSAIDDLFSEGDLVFNLKSILGKNTIKKIENFDGRIELQIAISLF